jgi:hypothetical protein
MAQSHMHLKIHGQKLHATFIWDLHGCFNRIMSGTIRENIVFSHRYDETFYNLVLDGGSSFVAKNTEPIVFQPVH